MLVTVPKYDTRPIATLPDGRTVNVHDVFNSSGVYDASTLHPIWTVKWYDHAGNLLWSPDFRFVARLNILGRRSPWALRFYDNGSMVRSYDCDTLLTSFRSDTWVPHTYSNWRFEWFDEFKLDATGSRVLLSTIRRVFDFRGHRLDMGLQEFYSFDLAGGAMHSKRVTGAGTAWSYVLLAMSPLLLAMAVVGCWLWRRMRRRDRRASTAGAETDHVGG